MIEAALLVASGFLFACLLTLFAAPAFWARAARISAHRIRISLPVNEVEISAEKDQLRAVHAVAVHRLEKQIERAERDAARQLVELNRRDAQVTDFAAELKAVTSELNENRNARHVLRQTLEHKLPKAESRLKAAQAHARMRDEQVEKFVLAATRQHRDLVDVRSIVTRQQSDIERMKATLTARESASHNRFGRAPAAESAEHAGLVERLSTVSSSAAEALKERERLRKILDDRTDEIADLRDQLAEFRKASSSGPDAAKVSTASVQSKLNRIEKILVREKDNSQRLRAELAAAHDRTARQAAQYRDEMKRMPGSPLQRAGLRSYGPDVAAGAAQASTDVTPAEPAPSKGSAATLAPSQATASASGETRLSGGQSAVLGNVARAGGQSGSADHTEENDAKGPPDGAADTKTTNGPRPPAATGSARGKLLDRLKGLND